MMLLNSKLRLSMPFILSVSALVVDVILNATTASAAAETVPDLRATDWTWPGSPYKVLDSGWMAQNHGDTYWLDNERVFFSGWNGYVPKKFEDMGRTGLFIWNTTTNQIQVYREHIDSYLCAKHGLTSYMVKKPGVYRTYMMGQIGKELAYEYSSEADLADYMKGKYFYYTLCRAVRYEDYGKAIDGNEYIIPLPYNGSFLSGDRRGDNSSRIYYHTPNNDPIQLDKIDSDRVSTHLIEYYQFNNSYFIPANRKYKYQAEWQAATCILSYWVHLDGSVSNACIPLGPWSSTSAKSLLVKPTKVGIFLAFHDISSGPSGPGGGYLSINRKLQRLIGGYINTISVSPSGCKIVFSHEPGLMPYLRYNKVWKTSLKMINICDDKQSAITPTSTNSPNMY